MKYERIKYEDLNDKQKEKYNYQKISAVLADYGFITIPLSDDWNGADFLAVHKDGDTLKIQLKGRMSFAKKYLSKDLHICFRDADTWYLYPHDDLLEMVNIKTSLDWEQKGLYTFPSLSKANREILKKWIISA